MKARKQKERDIVELEERLESLRASSVKVDAKVAKSECVRRIPRLVDGHALTATNTHMQTSPTKRHAASVITLPTCT